MRLQAYVRVTNNSGEDYENAQTRLIVGKVHILDQIAELGQAAVPYGRPGGEVAPAVPWPPRRRCAKDGSVQRVRVDSLTVAAAKPKEIVKEGLSEYFLYTIEGTETIPTGWSKRLPELRHRRRAGRQPLQVRGGALRPRGHAVPELQERRGPQARPDPDSRTATSRSIEPPMTDSTCPTRASPRSSTSRSMRRWS